VPDASSPGKGTDPDFEELLELSTEAARPLLVSVYDAGLPWPTLDYELPTPGESQGPEPDLAWPAQRVAVLAERQLEDRPAFEAVGWTVLTHPVDASELVALLRERGA
jgi:hypothetical protein